MRRATLPRGLCARAALACALPLSAALLLGACGRRAEEPRQELTFEKLPDTTGLSRGAAIVERFEPYRMPNGAVCVTGRVRLPDGTRLQIAIRSPAGREAVAMAQVVVQGLQFDTPPLLGDRGPLPKGDYRFEVLAHFNADWQSPEVLRATADGTSLRGPGMTRARDGGATLFLAREARL